LATSGISTTHSLEAFRGKRLVVKLGGEVMLNAQGLDSLAADFALLSREGVGVVVVHGGGPQADTLAKQLGHTVRKVAGRRVTDDGALEVVKMVYGGSINVELLARLKKHGARGVGLSGVDADLISVTRRPVTRVKDSETEEEEWVDFGHVGDIASVDASLLELLLEAGYVPVVASLAADGEGNIYNVNADTIAQALAVALGATRLVLVTNVPGILRDPTDPATLVPTCTPAKIDALVERGIISGGMLPKVQNCIEALSAGVSSVQILDGTMDRPPLLDGLISDGVGTVIVQSSRFKAS
jgi:acetylglutamate kinase